MFQMEKNALKNLKTSLEDNRAHLRRQLVAKEAEISRLNVQLRVSHTFSSSGLNI